MSHKTRNIIGWILTGLLALLMIWSAYGKLFPTTEMKGMLDKMGMTMDAVKIIGMLELLSIVLFIIPRTGIVGTLLLAAYLGGAIATHVEHAQPVMMPCIVEAVIWITAAIRFPELTSRLFGRTAQSAL
jgi:hypothetical protein